MIGQSRLSNSKLGDYRGLIGKISELVFDMSALPNV